MYTPFDLQVPGNQSGGYIISRFLVMIFGFVVITRHHELGLRQNIADILPTSLPELPIQLRDIRNNQKSLNVNF